jgi:hypothetical protein
VADWEVIIECDTGSGAADLDLYLPGSNPYMPNCHSIDIYHSASDSWAYWDGTTFSVEGSEFVVSGAGGSGEAGEVSLSGLPIEDVHQLSTLLLLMFVTAFGIRMVRKQFV